MRLSTALFLSILYVGHNAFPMCTDGEPPLMEANDAFMCDKGCPLGFNCEYQDEAKTLAMGICCANSSALQILYGDENENHVDPIWDLNELATASLNLQPHEQPSDKEKSSESNKREEKLQSKGSTSDSSVEENKKEADNSGAPTTSQPDSHESMISTETNTKMSEVPPSPVSEETATDLAMHDMADSTMSAPEVGAEIVKEMLEISAKTSSSPTTVASETSVNVSHLPGHNESELSTAAENAVSSTASPESIVSSYTKVAELTESEEGTIAVTFTSIHNTTTSQSSYSCKREKYKLQCHDGLVRTQPTLRWYLNSETEECEFYPWGYCPGDKIVESVTIRTKADCEELCKKKKEIDQQSGNKTMPSENDVKGPSSSNESVAVFDEGNSEMKPKGIEEQFPKSTELSENKHDEHTIEDSIYINAPGFGSSEPQKEVAQPNVENTSEGGNVIDKSETTEEVEGSGENTVSHIEPDMFDMKGTDFNDISEKESMEGISVKTTRPEIGKVQCERSPYRYMCPDGMPSQFVYRWVLNEGVCESSPYGYCYGAFNHPHPRTYKECTRLCNPQTENPRIIVL